MKKSLLFLVCCLGFVSGKAQSYYPMLSDSNTWYIYNNFEGCFTTIYFTSGDTVISNTQYEILRGESNCYSSSNLPPCPIAFLREDTLLQKVFVRVSSLGVGTPDTTEHVYYDFSLSKGDSIFLMNPQINSSWWYHFLGSGDTLGWYKVDTTYTIATLVGYRKALYMRNTKPGYSWQNMIWVESIGAVDGIYLYGGGQTWLSCGFRNNVREWAQFPNDTNCICISNGIKSITDENLITLFPNPATNQLNISIDESLVGAQLNIYYVTGSLVQSAQLQIQNSKFEIKNLPSGVYVAEIKTKEASVMKRWVKM